MTELLRRDEKTYFSYLPKDITTMIDGMERPIEKAPLRLIKELGSCPVMLSGGQNLIQAQSDPEPKGEIYHYQSVPDLTPLQITTEYHEFDLQTPGDQMTIYSDGTKIYVGDYVYRMQVDDAHPKIVPFNPDEPFRLYRFNKNQIIRGANNFIYFTCKGKLYRFHLSNPMIIHQLILPMGEMYISWVKPSLTFNRLVLEADLIYRWDLDTNTTTVVPFSPGEVKLLVIDPLTSLTYNVIRSEAEFKVIREDKVVMVSLPTNYHSCSLFYCWVEQCFITLSGHLILYVWREHEISTYLYG